MAEALRDFVRDELSNLLGNRYFLKALPAHLPPDAGSQARLPSLLEKLDLQKNRGEGVGNRR